MFLLTPAAWSQSWAVEMFDTTSHDFGSVGRGAKAEFEFVLTNRYLEDVQISSVSSSCGCTSAEITKPQLKTYESGSILARYNTDRFLGRKGATLTVHFSRPQRASVRLHVTGYIHNDLIVQPPSADLGTLPIGTGAERRVSVRYVGGQNLQITGVKSGNPHVSAEIVPVGGLRGSYELMVHLDDQAPAGYIKDNLLLTTTHPYVREIPVMVEARILPELTITPSTLFLGVLKPGQAVSRNIVIQGKAPFGIKSIDTDQEGMEIRATLADASRPIHVIPVTVVAGDTPGALVRNVKIQTDLSNETPELSIYAVVEP